ncbi:hypothetical protein [Pseudodesulfovibrio sp. JC047]|nr:hypothetical protein [Pseudodesulfovibrio sp. JC047]
MDWWTTLSPFWKGFICGGIAVPGTIILIEIVIKGWLRKKHSV